MPLRQLKGKDWLELFLWGSAPKCHVPVGHVICPVLGFGLLSRLRALLWHRGVWGFPSKVGRCGALGAPHGQHANCPVISDKTMLQLYKNRVVTSVAKRHIDIIQLELDWYTNNLWTLSQQASVLAGFSFVQVTTQLPTHTHGILELLFVLLGSVCLGAELCVVVTTTLCSMWGPGLALRGPDGTKSVHLAVDNLRAEQRFVFGFFVVGMFAFFVANTVQVWCFFHVWIAAIASVFLVGFAFALLYFTITLSAKLKVPDKEAVGGRISALRPYERIGDLDQRFASAVGDNPADYGRYVGGEDDELLHDGGYNPKHSPGEDDSFLLFGSNLMRTGFLDPSTPQTRPSGASLKAEDFDGDVQLLPARQRP